MGQTLSAVLDEARRQGFVGRTDELRSFETALTGSGSARVLFVHGVGGIGKTALLDELRRRATDAGRPPVRLDGRDVAGSIEAVRAAVGELGPAPVLLVDSYELLALLDRWFREQLLPSLPADAVVVLAGREPPGPQWLADPGWRAVLRVHDLGALPHPDSVALLGRLGVPVACRDRLAALGRGHPLTLALLAEVGDPPPAGLEELPGLVAELCRVLIRELPGEAHRTGLATCAHAFRTTEDLLVQTVGDRAAEVWAWLRARPFVGHTEDGLHLHDLVGTVFDAEFAHRNPDAYVALHRTIRQYAVARLLDPTSVSLHRDATELLLLHRHSPLSGPLQQVRESGALAVVPGTAADLPGVRALADVDPWLDLHPEGLYVARSDTGVEAFALHAYMSTDHGDPVVRAVLEAIDRRSPLRPGERVGIGRHIGARPGPGHDALLVLTASVSSIIEWLTKPAAWTVTTTEDEQFWRPFFEYLGFAVLARCGPVTAYGWDRRRLPVEAFLELTGRRELTGEIGPPPAELLRPQPMGRDAFAAAVRSALRDLTRADRLACSPLAATTLGPDVRAALVEGMDRLGAEPRGAGLRRVLDRTYLRPAPSQEAAAEVLGLPFSTYRRHLGRATDRLVDLLWAVETGLELSRFRPGG